MMSEHATSRYMVLHSNRSHTRRIYRKILNLFEGDFKILVKNGVLEEILWLISGSSLKIREESHVFESDLIDLIPVAHLDVKVQC